MGWRYLWEHSFEHEFPANNGSQPPFEIIKYDTGSAVTLVVHPTMTWSEGCNCCTHIVLVLIRTQWLNQRDESLWVPNKNHEQHVKKQPSFSSFFKAKNRSKHLQCIHMTLVLSSAAGSTASMALCKAKTVEAEALSVESSLMAP